MSGIFGIGLSGLNVAQSHLNTVSHNITNAGTAGYSRQTVIQVANDAEYGGTGYFGRGVQVVDVTRAYNRFLEQQVQASTARQAQYATYNAQISQINNMLADPEVGLSPVMNGFFAAVQDVVANPTNVPARQSLLSAAESTAARFRSMDARLQEIRNSTNGEIAYNVGRINTLATQIAELNNRISLAEAAGGGAQANDLQDQRNQVMVELNSIIAARSVQADDGSINVFIGTGQALVLGSSISRVTTAVDPDDPERLRVGIETPGGATVLVPEATLTNGALGGLLDFRREALDTTQRQLDLIARNFIEAVNELHRNGVDLDGLPGGDLFGSSMVSGIGAAANPPEIGIANDSLLAYDSYTLTYGAGGSYTLTRDGDGAAITDPASIGLSITVPADAVAGEQYRITPLAGSARDISMLISDPARFAAGLPASVTTVNTATVSVTPPAATSTASLSLAASSFESNGPMASFTVRFDGALNELVIDPAAGYTIAPDAGYDTSGPVDPLAGKTFTLTTPTGETFDFTLSGEPVDGDEFVFDFAVTSQNVDFATPSSVPTLDLASTATLALPADFEANGAVAPFVIRFDGLLNEVVIDPAAGYTIVPDSGYDTSGPVDPLLGKTFTLTTPTGETFDFTLAGEPVDGDEFALSFVVAPQTVYTATPDVTPDIDGPGTGAVSFASTEFEANGAMAPFAVRFDGVLNELVIDPATGYTLSPDAGYDTSGPVDPLVGKTFTLTTPTGETFEFTFSGEPADGDEFGFDFSIEVTETTTGTGPGDNRNAVALGALQNQQIMLDSGSGVPTSTLQSAYSQLVSFVGNKTREVQTAEKAQTSLLQQATNARESYSGVNLDEEAANLVRYQQAYQAAGRVLTVAQRLFDEVLSFGR
ncbi:MAG: flagellar hook-associated protein FlgK [Pseudazoarcus pumilus]|nr:flagellar hook-associated protein FlgK [Pseudazoarcus pumilus]